MYANTGIAVGECGVILHTDDGGVAAEARQFEHLPQGSARTIPKTPARDDYFAQSFRFTPEQAATIKEEAKRLRSTTAFVHELIDDHRTMFGLPNLQVEVLEADMKNLKIATLREYVRHLLALRYQTLLEERTRSKPGKR